MKRQPLARPILIRIANKKVQTTVEKIHLEKGRVSPILSRTRALLAVASVISGLTVRRAISPY